jgi:hypothetical protein
MGAACGMHGGKERCIGGFGGETEGKRTLGRPRNGREDNTKMYLQEVGWGMDVIYLTSRYKQVAHCYDYGNKPSGSTKCEEYFK